MQNESHLRLFWHTMYDIAEAQATGNRTLLSESIDELHTLAQHTDNPALRARCWREIELLVRPIVMSGCYRMEPTPCAS